MITPDQPAIVLAPMDGITDAPMRELQARVGCFSYAVSEFIRVSVTALPPKVFQRAVPEVLTESSTKSELPIQVQILGGDQGRMAISAANAVLAGANSIDINFGCPAPTVNRNDGGASLLRSPCRIREIVSAVRDAVPPHIAVSAKLRLGWDDVDDIHRNAEMAVAGGASWLTLHARTRIQGYQPPVFWPQVCQVRRAVGVPVIANGDIWSLNDFRRCQDETGCTHVMIGRGALANPALSYQIACELGSEKQNAWDGNWSMLFRQLVDLNAEFSDRISARSLLRLKQWAKLANQYGTFPWFEAVKRAETIDQFFEALQMAHVP
ncbi:MAG: tRNA-dihydrouridine synthase family protein [Chthonomonas sp.]|nr:tRNA-dihydrouridine synthase family protein [Chthonomonas sp.]